MGDSQLLEISRVLYLKTSEEFALRLNYYSHISHQIRVWWIKNLLAMQKICIQSLGQEDPLEKELATHSSILAWEIPCTEEPGRL